MSSESVAALVRAGLAAPPWQLPQVAADLLGEHLGANGVQILYADYAQRRLSALEQPLTEDPQQEWPIDLDPDGPGAVFATQRSRTEVSGAEVVLGLPLSARGQRIGVLRLRFGPAGIPAHLADEQGQQLLGDLAGALALLLVHADAATDRIERWRRSEDFSLAAELQWGQLPAQSVSSPAFTVAAHLEPAAQVTSDLYDWSWSPNRVWIALLDATGPGGRRGLACAQSAALALTALRNARRAGADLAEQAWLADQAVADHEGGTSAISALIAEIDPERGHALVIAAGAPLLILGQPGKPPWTLQHLTDQPPWASARRSITRATTSPSKPGSGCSPPATG